VEVTEGIFVTDGVNRYRMLLPLAGLVSSMEGPLATAIEHGVPAGMPLNLAHDKCRVAGWSVARGVYIAKDMARQVGALHAPETDEDRGQIKALVEGFNLAYTRTQIQPYADFLETRIRPLASEPMRYWHGEASAAFAPRLAAAVYPEFFDVDAEFVDKDGLVDYSELLRRTRQVQPGVFHEPERDLLLFAHPYFRRSMAHANSLNAFVLRSFDAAARANPETTARLRLDPDLLGSPGSAKPVMELEYWHGPRYDDDIEKIPSGVSEHGSTPGERVYSGISRTHIWWKDPETRYNGGNGMRRVRTFEIEELIEDPSPGLDREEYGCRYAHAEYDLEQRAISHFDGAIRAYGGDAYLERIDARIDRAGKHSRYTKLFRLDGALPISNWKVVLTDFYRGNRLLPEYLGAPQNDLAQISPQEDEPEGPSALPLLSAYLALGNALREVQPGIAVLADQRILLGDKSLPIAEIGRGRTAEVMRQWLGEAEVATMQGREGLTNLAQVVLPEKDIRLAWRQVAEALGSAIRDDSDEKKVDSISVAIGWMINQVGVTLSVAGEAALVGQLLEALVPVVRPDEMPSVWIEDLRDLLCKIAPDLDAPVAWPTQAVHLGRIVLERPVAEPVTG